MPEPIENVLPYFTAALFGLALLLFLVSWRLFRRSRKDVFWRRRREAGQRGWQFFVLGVVMLVLSAFFCISLIALTQLSPDDEPTPTAEIAGGDSGVDLPPPTGTSPAASDNGALVPPDATPPPEASVVVIVTATPGATPTETPFATFTPANGPVISSVTPSPGAQMVITAMDDQLSAGQEPVDPQNSFGPGTTRIYFFVQFRGMEPGVVWRRSLYRDGELIDGSNYLWGSEAEGRTYFFFGDDNGFPPGSYEIRLYLGDNPGPVSTMPFTVTA